VTPGFSKPPFLHRFSISAPSFPQKVSILHNGSILSLSSLHSPQCLDWGITDNFDVDN
jgi:hypothetical protein